MKFRAAICVPVRDEIERLPRLLEGINELELPEVLKPILCFAIDGSKDGSRKWIKEAVVEKRWKVKAIELNRLDVPNAGRARKAAMDLGRSYLSGQDILISTDADSRPVSNWLSIIAKKINRVDLLVGRTRRLTTTKFSATRARREAYLDLLHNVRRSIDPIEYDLAPSHPHISGANLAVRADVYDSLNGMQELENGEDQDFVARARLAGFKVRHERMMTVYTSNRTDGRATMGLAHDLKFSDHHSQQPVEHPEDAIAHYEAQALARAYYLTRDPDSLRLLSNLSNYDEVTVSNLANSRLSADAFVMVLLPQAQNARIVSVDEADEWLVAYDSKLAIKAS